MWSTQLFNPGRVMTTPGVGTVLDQFDGLTQVRVVIGLLIRHITGDWGEVDTDDQAANDHAVILGERLLSAYRLPDGTKVWVSPRPTGPPPRSCCPASTDRPSRARRACR